MGERDESGKRTVWCNPIPFCFPLEEVIGEETVSQGEGQSGIIIFPLAKRKCM